MMGAFGVGCGTPFPMRAIGEGLPCPLCEMDNEAVLAPKDAGANVTVTVCGAAPASTEKDAGVTENSAAFAPDTVMPDTSSGAWPSLPMVNVADRLWPTCTLW